MRKRSRSLASLLVAVLLLILSLPLPAAGAALTGTLVIRVQTAGGVLMPLSWISITGVTGEYKAQVPNDAWGVKRLRVPAGTYQVTAAAIRYEEAAPLTVTLAENQIQPITVVLSETANPVRIRGTITDSSTGKPAAGVGVYVMRDGVPEIIDATSDQKGAFSFPPLPQGTYRVVASGLSPYGEEVRTNDSKMVTLTSGQETEVSLRVVPKGRITAEVTTPDGKKAQAAELIITPFAAPDPTSKTVVADWGGSLKAALAPGVYTIKAVGLRYKDSQAQRITIMPGEAYALTFEVEPLATGTIRGVVTDSAGEPVANARVALHDARQQQVGAGARTGADGSFVFENVAVGTYELRPSAPNFVSADDAPEKVTVKAGLTAAPELALTPLVTVKVRLLDPDGKVIRSGYVHINGVVKGPSRDRDGNLLVPTLPGEVVLAAEAYGYLTSESRTVHIGAPGDPAIVTFHMQPQPVGTIEGRMVDARTGSPVSGLVVQLRKADDGLDLANSVRVDENGKFIFTDVPTGRYELGAQAYMIRTDPVVVTVEAGAAAQAVLPVRQFGQVEVRVVDRAGKALPGALVSTVRDGGEPWQVTANYLGRALYELEVGAYEVTATAPGMQVRLVQVAKVEPQKTTVVVVTMDPAGR